MDVTSAHNPRVKKWKPFVLQDILVNEFSFFKKKISLTYRGFDDLQINESTQYALVFFCFLRTPSMCHTNAIGKLTSLLINVSTDYADMQKDSY